MKTNFKMMSKKALALFIAIIMVAAMLPIGTFANEGNILSTNEGGTLLTLAELREAYGAITVEAYNIGQGFLLEPSLYPKEGKSTGDITVEYLTANNISFKGSTSYFSGMEFDDTVAPVYPEYLEPYMNQFEDSGDGNGFLEEFDYSWAAGWVYTINDWWASWGASDSYPGQEITDYNTQEKVTLGDVIRWHFTVYGYGADCGFASNVMAEYSGGNLFTQEDKSDLIFLLAALNSYYGNSDADDVYETALAVAADPLASAEEIADQEVTLVDYIEGLFPRVSFTLDLTGLEDSIYYGGICCFNFENNENDLIDESADDGQKLEYEFVVGEYDQYILYVDFYQDSPIMGWSVNGVPYTIDASESVDDWWDFGNDTGVGYGFGYEEEGTGRLYDEFSLLLGEENPYETESSWVVKPLILTDEIIDVIVAIDSIEDVTLESGDDIAYAWELYNALSDVDKAIVFNYDILVEAQAVYDVLRRENAASPIDVYVTIANKGNLILVKEEITVIDLDASGDFNVEEVLIAAHEDSFAGGSSGYGTDSYEYDSVTYKYINKFWGEETMNVNFICNHEFCWSLDDSVVEGDYVVAYIIQNTEVWDPYARFDQDTYSALTGAAVKLSLEISGYDDDYNVIFSAHKGAIIKLYDADFNEISAAEYSVIDNGDGTYSLTVKTVGDYTVVAYDNATPTAPAICSISVSENPDIPAANQAKALINAIGSVTTSSKTAIEAARAAYDALTDAQKALVDNYNVLVAAEESFAKLNSYSEAAAATVSKLIEDIGDVTVHSGNKIKAARAAYSALTDAQKALVNNLAKLTDAEDELAELYVEAAKADYKSIYDSTVEYLLGCPTPVVGSIGGEWLVIDLVRAGYACPEGYYENVLKYVEANINDKEQLHRRKSTDNSRIILALAASGYDVTDVGGHNLLFGLTDMEYVKWQGINGPIWALIALDCCKFDIPLNPNAEDQVTREKLIAYILDAQLADGGWALSGTKADPDMTGMALQSLAPYYNTDVTVKAAVEKALECLSNIQLDNGAYGSYDGSCSESCAQVIVALTALGINPETDSRFVKNGMSVLDAICMFAIDGGGFSHIPDDKINQMATEQGQYALVAYDRFLKGATSLYDYSDVTSDEPSDPSDPSTPSKPTVPEISATLGMPGSVENKADTTFNGVINVNAWSNDAGFKLIDAIVNVPNGLKVTGVVAGNRLNGGELNYHLEEETGKLRIVYFDANNYSDLTVSGTSFPTDLFTITFKVDSVNKGDNLGISIGGMSIKLSSDSTDENSMVVVDTTSASGSVAVVGGISFSAVCLYEGDGIDLIPEGKKAVAISVTGIKQPTKLMFKYGNTVTGIKQPTKLMFKYGNTVTEFKYSKEMSDETGVCVYVALVDANIEMKAFVDQENFTFAETNASELTFGDANGDGIINAQDALAAVDTWLRKTEEPTDDEILALNVNGDSRINTFDALSIVEAFVNNSKYIVVTKSAVLNSKN